MVSEVSVIVPDVPGKSVSLTNAGERSSSFSPVTTVSGRVFGRVPESLFTEVSGRVFGRVPESLFTKVSGRLFSMVPESLLTTVSGRVFGRAPESLFTTVSGRVFDRAPESLFTTVSGRVINTVSGRLLPVVTLRPGSWASNVACKRSGMKIVTNTLCGKECKLNAIFASLMSISEEPATKLIKIRKAVMRQTTKIRGLRVIPAYTLFVAAISMPVIVMSQSLPAEDEWVVVIDAGHGGRDPGAVVGKTKEKNINLSVALKTGRYISKNIKDVKVIYTREDDTFLGLDERAEVANRNKANLFISIHSNAMTDKRFSGAETYVLGHTMDEANLQVAMKENSVITFEKDYETKYKGFDPNSVESYIIFSLMQNTYLRQSTEFATLIQNQFRERVGRKDRGVRQAGFQVLWMTTMPSVLVELGFITNAEEEKFLISEQGQDYLASAIFRAFRDYKQTIDSRSGVRNGKVIAQAATPAAGTDDSTAGRDTQLPSGQQEAKPAVPAAGNESKTADQPARSEIVPSETAVKSNSGQTETAVKSDSGQAEKTVKSESGTAAANPGQATPAPADNIYFMVQVAAMPKNRELTQSQLKGLEPISRIEDGERIKYASGKFVLYDDALKHRRTLTGRYPDAFVIAVRSGKIMPLKEAIEQQKR